MADTYLVLLTDSGRYPTLSLVKSETLHELVLACKRGRFKSFIFTLKPTDIQPTLPWKGTKLTQVARVEPHSYTDTLLEFVDRLQGLEKAQVDAEIDEAISFLNINRIRLKDRLTQIEEDEQTEVFEINNSPEGGQT